MLVVGWEAFIWSGPLSAVPAGAPFVLLLPPTALLTFALVLTWPQRRAVRLEFAIGCLGLESATLLATHLMTRHIADYEIATLYPHLGSELLRTGHLPQAPYPAGAVVLFAIASRIGSVTWSLPVLTLAPLLLALRSLARLHESGPWLVIALFCWPSLLIFWELRFEPLPAALFVLGLTLFRDKRWFLAGLLLGVGGAIKWYPWLCLAPLVVCCIRQRMYQPALRLMGLPA